jgi:hypothetical protein
MMVLISSAGGVTLIFAQLSMVVELTSGSRHI